MIRAFFCVINRAIRDDDSCDRKNARMVFCFSRHMEWPLAGHGMNRFRSVYKIVAIRCIYLVGGRVAYDGHYFYPSRTRAHLFGGRVGR